MIPPREISRRQLLKATGTLFAGTTASLALPFSRASAAPEPVVETLLEAVRIARQIRQPSIPARTVVAPLVAGGSAKANHSTLQHTIFQVAEAGGGRICIPPGLWEIAGPIRVVSNIDLHISKGATISFIDDKSYHLPPVLSRWEGTDMVGYAPYLYAYQATNIAITGSGTLDGNGSNRSSTWSRNETIDINRLREMGRTLAPVQQRIFGEGHSLRPPFIQLYSCSNVLLEGIGIEDFPFWGLHLLYSNDLTIRNISVCSLASNNDGIDVDSSHNVLIEKCIFQTKDDCIAIKSGRDADGRAVNRPSSDIVIRDCRMIHGGSSGVAIGSEMSGGIRGVYIIRCTMDAVSSMLTVKSNLDRGGRVEHIRAWNVRVGNCSHVLHVTTAYHSYSGGIFPPIIRDIAIDDVVCENTECAFDLMGSVEAPLHEIALQNIEIHRAVTPMRRAFTNSLLTRNILINGRFS